MFELFKKYYDDYWDIYNPELSFYDRYGTRHTYDNFSENFDELYEQIKKFG